MLLLLLLPPGRSKYFVRHVIRTNMACDDAAFNCVAQLQDEHGIMGVRLNKDIVQVRVKGGWEGVWGGRDSTGRRA